MTAQKPKLQQALALTDVGYTNLKKSIAACTLTNLSLMIPFLVTVMAFAFILTGLTGEEIEWSRMWALFGAGIAGFAVVFLCARNDYRNTYFSAYTESEAVRMGLAEHLRLLPMSFFNRRDLADITENLMGDATSQESMLSSTLPQLVASGVSTVLVCTLLAFFDWRLALCVLVTLPLSFAIVLLSRNHERVLFTRQNQARIEASERISEYIKGIKDIRACRQVGEKSASMHRALTDLKNIAMRVELSVDISVSIATTILQAGVGITVFVGTYLLTGSQIDFLTLLMFLLIVSRIYGPITSILPQLPTLLMLTTKTKRIRDLREEPVSKGSLKASLDSYEVRFEDVRFGYGNDEVIKGVSFTIEEGRITALVGPSGSGKSTIARLVARLWSPTSGLILAGGKDTASFDEESWLQNVSIVFQDVTLFDDTVMNNIRIGRADATDDEIKAAARAAFCGDFIERLPEGWETRLGENGAKLSGGERQRLSIARALLKDAPIILLDEATSSLDPENETMVQRAIGRVCAGKTVLVIAHRLRTVSAADKIIVLDEGKIVEQGTHDFLMEADSLYSRMFNTQTASLSWNVKR